MRDYREYFEKVKRDYKVRVKRENVPRISWFYVNFDYREFLRVF